MIPELFLFNEVISRMKVDFLGFQISVRGPQVYVFSVVQLYSAMLFKKRFLFYGRK